MLYVFMRYPGGKTRAVTFSYDDGKESDKRLAEIFDIYQMKATFNFNNEKIRPFDFTKEQIQEYFLSKGHEIAVHGEHHRATGNIRTIEGIREVLNNRLELEQRCGCIVRGMAYPDAGITMFGNFGTYEQVKNYLTELDIAYARTHSGDNDKFILPDDFHAWVPSAHHDNPQIMEYVDKFLELDIMKQVHNDKRVPRLLYIWGHSVEFDRNDNWDHMEEICRKLAFNDDIWYATNIEIYDYVQAYKRLIYSADGRIVYNPSVQTVWFDCDSKMYSVKPGETIYVE